jgi:peptidoglycan/LPS O-acetylase OafA/YrhL
LTLLRRLSEVRELWEDERVTAIARRSARGALVALIGVSLAGTADVAQFIGTRTSMFTDVPGRAAGSVVGLVAWAALLGVAAGRYAVGDRRWSRVATIGLAGMVAAGSVGLTAIHLKAGVGGARPIVGGVLGVLALILALAATLRSPKRLPLRAPA